MNLESLPDPAHLAPEFRPHGVDPDGNRWWPDGQRRKADGITTDADGITREEFASAALAKAETLAADEMAWADVAPADLLAAVVEIGAAVADREAVADKFAAQGEGDLAMRAREKAGELHGKHSNFVGYAARRIRADAGAANPYGPLLTEGEMNYVKADLGTHGESTLNGRPAAELAGRELRLVRHEARLEAMSLFELAFLGRPMVLGETDKAPLFRQAVAVSDALARVRSARSNAA